jgi:Tat protein translocase TatB subunit
MFNVGPLELMVILMVALIVVGPKRLPEIGRQIGRAFTELRRVQDEVRDTIRFDFDDDPVADRPIHRDRPGALDDDRPARRLTAVDDDPADDEFDDGSDDPAELDDADATALDGRGDVDGRRTAGLDARETEEPPERPRDDVG